MDLVIDASIVFTGLTGVGITKEIIFSDVIVLYSPEFLFDEIDKYKSRITELSGLSKQELEIILNKLRSRIIIVPREKFENFLATANSLISDKDDTEYLALSLSMNKLPIWSNDLHFTKQSVVKVFTTSELTHVLKSLGYTFSPS